MPNNSPKHGDLIESRMELPNVTVKPTPMKDRKGIKISEKTKALYAAHDHSQDDPESPVLPPDKWAHAMRREELFRPIKKQTTVRIDADVLEWLKSQGQGYLTRINDILRREMLRGR